MSLISKTEWLDVRELSHSQTYMPRSSQIFSKLSNSFHDYCFFKMSGELIVVFVPSCLWRSLLQEHSPASQHHIKAVLLRRKVTIFRKNSTQCTTFSNALQRDIYGGDGQRRNNFLEGGFKSIIKTKLNNFHIGLQKRTKNFVSKLNRKRVLLAA